MPHAVVASYVAAFTAARSLTRRVIEGADHGLSREPWKQAYTELLVGWLKEMSAAASATPPRAVTAATARVPEES